MDDTMKQTAEIYHVITDNTIEPQWLEHLKNHENMFETGVVRANEC